MGDRSGAGLHHFHKRVRIHQKHEKYPHPNKWKRFMDNSVYLAGILGPILTIPQLVKIWVQKNASGISIVSWVSFLVSAIFWLAYGIMHKEKPIILTYAIWIGIDLLVVIGAFLYGGGF